MPNRPPIRRRRIAALACLMTCSCNRHEVTAPEPPAATQAAAPMPMPPPSGMLVIGGRRYVFPPMQLKLVSRDATAVQTTLETLPTPDDATANRLALTVPLDIDDPAAWANAEGHLDLPPTTDANESGNDITLPDRSLVLVPRHLLMRVAQPSNTPWAAVRLEGLFVPLDDTNSPASASVQVTADVWVSVSARTP